MQVNLFSMKQRQTKNFTVQPFRIVYSRNSLMTTRPVRPHRTLCTCVAGKGKGISWKVRSNFVIQPALLCVLQYQSDMLQDHQRASALICWRLGVCGAQRLTFHLAQNLGFTLASVIRWLTIIAPRENGRAGGTRETETSLWVDSAVFSVLWTRFLFSRSLRHPT